MKNGLIYVLIADDEPLIRQGLRATINWSALGFHICGEAGSGEEALEKIHACQPDLVLLDIRMPRMYGTELMKLARQDGYEGYFIILSGYSDFQYAQDALRFGASYYLTKPVDEEELTNAVLAVKDEILKKASEENSYIQYMDKAKKAILPDLLKKGKIDNTINYAELGLSSYLYQVVIYESYTPYYNLYSFADMLLAAGNGAKPFEEITIDNRNVIILKGNDAMERFNRCLEHYKNGTQKGSPLDILFLTYGPAVTSLEGLHTSYEACCMLLERRFFCAENQHVLSYEQLPQLPLADVALDSEQCKFYSDRFVSCIQSFNRRQLTALLGELHQMLYGCNQSIDAIKYFLIDIFLQIKQSITYHYGTIEIPFPHNAAIMELLTKKYYLHEILAYFHEQSEMIMRAIGNNSSESILDDILYYLDHNYQENLKLKTLTSLFGYNSSYLGKLFKERVGMNFNTYLDTVRVEKAADLLTQTDLRIYEISAKVRYKNADYFQQKFKKIKGINPTDYRVCPYEEKQR